MQSNSAFKILGIDPTNDGRLIRSAYVRLARIYHPDRFVGMPDDVRIEAERRMKEATVAYQELRSMKRTSDRLAESPDGPVFRNDMWEKAKRARDTVEEIRREQERSRTRWMLWEELEKQARDRAEWEARMAAQLAKDPPFGRTVHLDEDEAPDAAAVSALSRRLQAAKEGKQASLARARNESA
jgi:curved DNA-binding protein CbpA